MTPKTASRLAAALLCATCAAGPAMAQSAAPAQALLDGAFVVNLGAFIVTSDVRASLNGQSVDNPEIDFDEALGRSSGATRVRADVLWRITPTHHLRFMYFNDSVSRSRAINESLPWGDYTFGVGANVDYSHKMKVYELVYEYAFMRTPTYEIAASGGLHVTDMTLGLSGAATVTRPDGTTESASRATQSNSVSAPLPVLGIHGGWMVAPSWFVDAQAQFFRANVNGYDGYWSDLRAGATWMYSRNLGLGLGYNRFATSLAVSRDGFDGRLRTAYSGLQAYVTMAF
jgi:hypothetical protein